MASNPNNPDKKDRKYRGCNNPNGFGRTPQHWRVRKYPSICLLPAAADSDLSAKRRAERKTAKAVRDDQLQAADSTQKTPSAYFGFPSAWRRYCRDLNRIG